MTVKEAPEYQETFPHYPELVVTLLGEDGNAFSLLGIMGREMRRYGVPQELRDKFFEEATSGDYDHMIQTFMRWAVID